MFCYSLPLRTVFLPSSSTTLVQPYTTLGETLDDDELAQALPLLSSLKRLRLPSIAEVDRSPAGKRPLLPGKLAAKPGASTSRRDLRRAVGCRESPLKEQLDRCFTDDSAQLLQVPGALLAVFARSPLHVPLYTLVLVP